LDRFRDNCGKWREQRVEGDMPKVAVHYSLQRDERERVAKARREYCVKRKDDDDDDDDDDNNNNNNVICSSVDIATDYGLDGPGIKSLWGRDFPHLSRPALGPTQPPVQ
jgi:hypothetical protein